jgi:hypothetical protein
MHSMLNPKQTDDPHDIVAVAPDVVQVAPADEELADLLHDAARYLSDAQTRTGSDAAADPPVPPVDTTFRPAAVNDVQVPGHPWWIGRGAVRALAALLLAACTGVAAIAWQSQGDAAKQMIATWAPQLALTSSPPPENPGLPEQPAPPPVQADTATAALPQPAPPAQTAAESVAPAAAVPAEPAQLLQSMARDLASVGQEIGLLKASIAELKASQQQMSREIAKASEAKASEVKASEQNLRPRIAASPPRSAAAPARKPMPPLPPRQAAAAPSLPQAAAASAPRQLEPPPQASAQPPADPEFSSVPRPPMPLRPSIGSFTSQ